MKTVLLTNAQQRKTLAAARSLGCRGIEVIVAEETRLNPAAFSKYCKKALVYPSPKKRPKDFYNWLHKTIINYNCDILYPMDDDALSVVMQHYKELSAICSIPVPAVSSYEIASDKGEAVRLAASKGIECPNTIFVQDIEELRQLASAISYPALIKPRRSSGSRGICIVNTQEELINKYSELHIEHPYPIIQEYIGIGDRYDVCLLFDREHRLKASFVQKELRHFPIPIGPSTLQESVIYPELVEKTLGMAETLNWYGVIEFEYMVDNRDGKLKFMEINPRFWASIQTAIQSGIDFPWLLYRVSTDGEVEGSFNYEAGVKCRWLFPGDIFHYLTNKERRQMNPPFWHGKGEGIYDDIMSMEDPMPLLGFLLACARYVFDINMWRFIFRR